MRRKEGRKEGKRDKTLKSKTKETAAHPKAADGQRARLRGNGDISLAEG